MTTQWRSGELDQRISFIFEDTSQNDGFGGQEVSLNTDRTAWAKVVPRNGNERFFGEQVQATSNYMFVIRNRSDVTLEENNRILYNGEEYNIDYIPKRGDRALYIEIFATRGVTQ